MCDRVLSKGSVELDKRLKYTFVVMKEILRSGGGVPRLTALSGEGDPSLT